MKSFGVPVVVAVNRFDTDSEEELNTVIERCHELGAECALSEVFAKGSEGGLTLPKRLFRRSKTKKLTLSRHTIPICQLKIRLMKS